MTTTGDVTPYLALIPPMNAGQPKFMGTLAALCQPFADIAAVNESMPTLFDLDNARGDQLDKLGEWIGISRYLSEPLTGIYFTLNSATLGLNQGILKGQYDSADGLVALPDGLYLTLLRARIAYNQWDGTIGGAYSFLDAIFPGGEYFIQNAPGGKAIYIGVLGEILDAGSFALLTGGYLNIKPAGVRIAAYVTSSVVGAPIFGLNADNATIGGLNHGAFGTFTEGT